MEGGGAGLFHPNIRVYNSRLILTNINFEVGIGVESINKKLKENKNNFILTVSLKLPPVMIVNTKIVFAFFSG